MGVGGSTSRPNSSTVIMAKRPQTSCSEHSIHSNIRGSAGPSTSLPGHGTHHRPTDSCCSHFRENHAGVTRTVTPAVMPGKMGDSIDDEIEEIVANTIDLMSNNRTRPNTRDTDRGGGARQKQQQPLDVPSHSASSGVVQRRIIHSGSMRIIHKGHSGDESDFQFDAKDAIPEVDFAKFKKVNHQGATIQNNGRIIHHQESDLLWRLGLISPEAYKINTGTRGSDVRPRRLRTRSAPNQGPYLKTPSYDLTEEQLMANIEKEFECTI